MRKKLYILIIFILIIFPFIPSSLSEQDFENNVNLPPTTLIKEIPSTEFSSKGLTSTKEKAIIELYEKDTSFLNLLNALNIEVESFHNELIQIKATPNVIAQIEKWDTIKSVRKPRTAIPFQIESEGVKTIGADKLHNLEIKGGGINIAVIDLGFNIYNPEIAPNIIEYQSFRADGDITGGLIENWSHGTAVTEIITDTAPKSKLFLFNFETDVEYLNAVDYAISKNVSIISTSIGFLNVGPNDGTNYIDKSANKAREHGILFVAAAGNEAEKHWTGSFRDDDNDDFLNFTNDDETNDIIVNGNSIINVFLSWEDWPYSNNDYDLYLYDETSNFILAFSSNQQTGSQPPIEELTFHTLVPGTYRIAIKKVNATTSMRLHLFSTDSELEYYIEEGSLTSPGDALGSFTIGATTVENDEIEPFSSQGPTADGRIKPDLTAPDGVTTSIFGQKMFYGTSASAPHATGAAALLLEVNPKLRVNELEKILKETAKDLGLKGEDNIYGAGRLDVYAAYRLLQGYPEKVTLTIHSHPNEYKYPEEPPFELNTTFLIAYRFDESYFTIEEQPFSQILVDYGSIVNITVKTFPLNYTWVEWENYGFEKSSSTNIEIQMEGNRTLIAYFEYIENTTLPWISIHAHPNSIQYPNEPSQELNISLQVSFILNNNSQTYQLVLGPKPTYIQTDKNSNINITVTKIPFGYEWNEWDIYGLGRFNSETLTTKTEKNLTIIAYLTLIENKTGDFIISINPQIQTYVPGQKINFTIITTPIDNFNSTLTISVEAPSGVTAFVYPDTIIVGEKSILTLTTKENTPAGPLEVTVKASGGGKEHSTHTTLQRWIIPWLKIEEIITGLLLGFTLIFTLTRLRKSWRT